MTNPNQSTTVDTAPINHDTQATHETWQPPEMSSWPVARAAMNAVRNRGDVDPARLASISSYSEQLIESEAIDPFAEEIVKSRGKAYDTYTHRARYFVHGHLANEHGQFTDIGNGIENYSIKKALEKERVSGKERTALASIVEGDLLETEYADAWERYKGYWIAEYANSRSTNVDIGANLHQPITQFISRDPAIGRTLVEKAKERARLARETHGETIRDAIEFFPEYAQKVLEEHGIEYDQELFMQRFEEARERVHLVSYLDDEMESDWRGGQYASDGKTLLSADLIVTESKNAVMKIVFHELFHAVSKDNYFSSAEGNSIVRGSGIVGSKWLNEGMTEFFAREALRLNNLEVDGESYIDRVDLLQHLKSSRPKLFKKIGHMYMVGNEVGQKFSNSAEAAMLAEIEQHYGSGFLDHVDDTMRRREDTASYEEYTALEAEINRIKQYMTERDAHFGKRLRNWGFAAGGVVMLATAGAGGVAIGEYMQNSGRKGEVITAVEAEEEPALFQNVEQDEALAIIHTNRDAEEPRKFLIADNASVEVFNVESVNEPGDRRTMRLADEYKNAIWLIDSDGSFYYIVQSKKSGVELLEGGSQMHNEESGVDVFLKPNEADATKYTTREVTPVITEEGILIDLITGEAIGERVNAERDE